MNKSVRNRRLESRLFARARIKQTAEQTDADGTARNKKSLTESFIDTSVCDVLITATDAFRRNRLDSERNPESWDNGRHMQLEAGSPVMCRKFETERNMEPHDEVNPSSVARKETSETFRSSMPEASAPNVFLRAVRR